MHVYVYDARLDNTKYHPLLAKIETRLTDLGLNGKIVRLNPMHNLERTIRDEFKPDRTIVLVGGDSLVNSTLSILCNHDAVIGIIPIGKDSNTIATSFGIEPEVAACDVLAARRVMNIDLGLANNSAFINQLLVQTDQALIETKNNISLEISSNSTITINNLTSINHTEEEASIYDDGLLELNISSTLKKPLFGKTKSSNSFVQSQEFLINGDFECLLDNCFSVKTPINVSVATKAIKIIVGKKRIN
jgi:hypothetical protein